MEPNKDNQMPASEADMLDAADVQMTDEQPADADAVDADSLSEDEIITFGVNDDKPKKRFLEEKVDTSKPEIDAEDYDIHIPIKQPEDADARIAGKTPVRISYDMTGDEVAEGLKFFHKQTLVTKNLIYSFILFVIFCLYVYRIVTVEAVSSMQYFLAVLCVALIGFIWYTPTRHIKATREAVEKERHTFTVDVYDTCLMVGELDNQTMVDFEMAKPRVIAFETALNFCVGVGKEKIFILPKRCVKDAEDDVRACLQTGFGNKYKDFSAQ